MARLVLITGDDPDALLRTAAAPFCTPGRILEPLPLLAVRQGGLRDAVHEFAAQSGCAGWLGNPIVVFSELPGLFVGASAPLDEFERQAFVARALIDGKLEALDSPRARRTLVAALDRLFGDLAADGVTPAAFSRGLSAIGEDGADGWARKRNADVAALHQRYVEAIASLPERNGVPRSDGRDGLLAAARAIEAAGEGELFGLRRPFQQGVVARSIDIYGLADLRRGWRRFLGALRESPAVDELRVYLLDGPPDEASSEVRAWAREHVAAERRVGTTRTFGPALERLRREVLSSGTERVAASGEVTLTSAPDLTRELEDVARRVKGLLVNGDSSGARVLPREIAVIARKARPYLSRAADIFERYGIPTYARLRHNLPEIPAIAALLRVFDAAADVWPLARLAELSQSPYFAADLDMSLLREVSRGARPASLAAWASAVAAIDPKLDEGDDEHRVAWRQRRIEDATKELARLASELAVLDGAKTFGAWAELTIQLLGGAGNRERGVLDYCPNVFRPLSPSEPRILLDAARLDAAAVRSAVDLVIAWRDALAWAPTRSVHAGDWRAELEQMLAERDVTLRTGERGGVHLLEATASEGQSFEHLFVVGMSAGSFPAAPGRDVLFDDGERHALFARGLPIEPAPVWANREAALFRGLMAAPARSLHLSYAYADVTGSAQLGSAYLDDLVSRIDRAEAVDGVDPSWRTAIPGSRVAPSPGDAVWCEDEALRAAAISLRDGDRARSASSVSLLAAASLNRGRQGQIAQLLHAAAMERVRDVARAASDGIDRRALAHAWNGRIESADLVEHLREQFGDKIWSATQLETYGRCGFSFFGKYVLRTTELEEDDDDELSARDAGTVMHAALAATYQRLLEHDPDHPLSEANRAVALEIVDDAVRHVFEAAGMHAAAGVLEARIRETTILVQEYVGWEIAQNEKAKDKTRPLHMELGFGMDDGERPPVVLEANGRRLRLRGRIDRVDELIPEVVSEYRYIVDHKTGGGAFSALGALQQEGAVLQLALYLAALDQVLPGSKPWGGTYQIIGTRRRVAALDRGSIVGKGQVKVVETKTQQEHDAKIRNAAQLALAIVDGILDGRFAARVPEKAECLAYCQFREACREERIKSW